MIFDLDGVLLDSEPVWEEERRRFVAEHGGRWQPDSQARIMGMSTLEWATYLSRDLGVGLTPEAVAAGVVERMTRRYERRLPLMEGAADAVRRLGARWRLGLASSSPRSLIEVVLVASGLAPLFAATVSSDEVAAGKPAPDVYLEAAGRLDAEPGRCTAVEDSGNGLRSAAAAGMCVVAIPNLHYPPAADALAEASLILESLRQLTVASVEVLPCAS